MPFPERIYEIRHNMRMSQEKFAELFNLSQRSIAGWESGQRSPSFSKLCEVADLLNVSVDYLLGRTDSPCGYYDTKKNPSPDDRERAVRTSAAALKGKKSPVLTEEELQWLAKYIDTAIDRALDKRGIPSDDPAGSPDHTVQ